MFKAKLINNKKYYKYRSLLFLVPAIPAIVISLLVSSENLSAWSIAVIIISYLILLALSFLYVKRMGKMIGKEIIEFDGNEIRVNSKKTSNQEIIQIKDVDKIFINKTYGIPQETLTDIAKEVKGEAKENYIILQKGNEKRQFDFEIDSYYMINQLNKVIANWEGNGYQIERI